MRHTLALAERARGHVEPNPMVGAVLARPTRPLAPHEPLDAVPYQVLAQGHHRVFGGPHAEVEAIATARAAGLNDAQRAAATLFVTLEPCCHHAKQPPCTDAIRAAGIRHVVAAMTDPDPRVAGRGTEQLRAAGVRVDLGLCEHQARWLNRGFISRVTRGRPWVRVKWAQTLDGRVAARTGHSQWISNEQSRARVHAWRATADAILTGIGTVLADDPQLTARRPAWTNTDANADTGVKAHAEAHADDQTRFPPRLAHRVVVDPRLRTPLTSRLVQSLQPATDDANPPPKPRLRPAPGPKPGVDHTTASLTTPPLTLACHPDALNTPQATALQQAGVRLLPLPRLEAGTLSKAPAEARETTRQPLQAEAGPEARSGVLPGAKGPDRQPPHTNLDLRPLLAHLDATHVLVEAGPGLIGSLFRQQLVDELAVFIAPRLLGDPDALPPLRGFTPPTIADGLALNLHSTERLGDDLLLTCTLV